MENKIKETVINESTVFSTDNNDDKIVYRIIASADRGQHCFSIAAESMLGRHSDSSRIDGFSDSLNEASDFVKYLVTNKITPHFLFEEALKFMTSKLHCFIKDTL